MIGACVVGWDYCDGEVNQYDYFEFDRTLEEVKVLAMESTRANFHTGTVGSKLCTNEQFDAWWDSLNGEIPNQNMIDEFLFFPTAV